jgi:hypothetical protein
MHHMRHLVLNLAYAVAILVNPATAIAVESGVCYNVQDSDARTMCLARARHDPGQCYSIQRADLRSQCLAEVAK